MWGGTGRSRGRRNHNPDILCEEKNTLTKKGETANWLIILCYTNIHC